MGINCSVTASIKEGSVIDAPLIKAEDLGLLKVKGKERFTPACGHVADKHYHRVNKIYWCRHCSDRGRFTPYKMKHFAPFSSLEEGQQLQKEMRAEQLAMVDFQKWIGEHKHVQWVAAARAAGCFDRT